MNDAKPALPRLVWLRALLIVSAGFWVFAPSLHGDWLMDDDFYLTQNALLHDPHRLWKTWFAPGSLIEYYPIEATLQAVQWHFWHLDTLGYHVTNLVLHITGALLVWRLLEKFGLRLAWLGGLLFVIHPATVESVAWISEFKNTLSLPPFLLALCRWLDFESQGRSRDYLLALGWFLLAMLCKISMALFPIIILLYAWWKRDRVSWSDFRHAAPFFALTLTLGLTNVFVGQWFRISHLEPATNPDIGGPLSRLVLAGQSLAFYFTKAVFPIDLIPIYPKWPVQPASPWAYVPWVVVIGAFAFCWMRRATWGRHALLGGGFFLINLLPFLGLNSVTYMGFTWVMDHFLYLPMIGLVGLAVAALEGLDAQLSPPARPWLVGGIALVFALLALESETYAGVFIGPEKLWTYTLAHNPTSWLAHNNLGDVDLETGRTADAITQFKEALRSNPTSIEAHTNLGFAYELSGRMPEALAQYLEALRYSPHFALTQAHLGHLYETLGLIPEAISHDEDALRANPGDDATRAALERLKNGKTGAE